MDINKIFFLKHRNFRQFIKFCIVGTIAALINFFVLCSLTEWFSVWYLISAVIGGVISAIWNFLANKFWTFRNLETGKETFKQAVKFILVVCIGVGLNTLIIYFLTEFAGLDYRLSWVFATGIVLFWNFGLNKIWTFKHQLSQSDSLPPEPF